ncbi:hypothetical protein AEMCBJ_01715 [Cupriavidus necator]
MGSVNCLETSEQQSNALNCGKQCVHRIAMKFRRHECLNFGPVDCPEFDNVDALASDCRYCNRNNSIVVGGFEGSLYLPSNLLNQDALITLLRLYSNKYSPRLICQARLTQREKQCVDLNTPEFNVHLQMIQFDRIYLPIFSYGKVTLNDA